MRIAVAPFLSLMETEGSIECLHGQQFEISFDLRCQRLHDAQSAAVTLLGKTDAIIHNREFTITRARCETNANLTAAPAGEGVLEGICEELCDNQPDRNCSVDIDQNRLELRRHSHPLVEAPERDYGLVANIGDIAGQIDVIKIAFGV